VGVGTKKKEMIAQWTQTIDGDERWCIFTEGLEYAQAACIHNYVSTSCEIFFRRSHICGIGLLELLLRLLVCLDWVSPPSFYASVSVGMGHDIFTNMVFLAMRIAKVVDASFQTFGQQSVADPRSIFHPKKRVCLKSRTTSRFGFKCRHTRGDRGLLLH